MVDKISGDHLMASRYCIVFPMMDYGSAYPELALIGWEKVSMPIINGCPSGLSDDFRDPYFFRTGNGAYIIVGSSKNGIGTTTLHAYNPSAKSWSNDGKTFFTGSNVSTCGTFWEMPNITPIGDKWLFTVTPQNTSKGVASLYWIGTINADGTFNPDKISPSDIELPGFARDGFGMLSPTICQHDGKTIALGIVPDKLPSQANYELGYAHTYSLPREWSIDSEGNLCQKPYSGLAAMRDDNGFSKEDFTLYGALDLDGVTGRTVELCGEFTVGTGKCGFTILDDGVSSVKIYYDGATNEIVVDSQDVNRLINDSGVFNGYYNSTLPGRLAKGETIKLNVFFDHSILDIFINDKWASSVRIFANNKTIERITAFSDTPDQVHAIKAWNLNAANGCAGAGSVITDGEEPGITVEQGCIKYRNISLPAILSVYSISGAKMIERNLDAQSGDIDTNLKGLHLITLHTATETYSQKIFFIQ